MSTKVSDEARAEWLGRRPGWKVRDGVLTKDFVLGSFRDSIVFVNRVASLADEANHHPDIDIRYDRVRIGLVTHDAGGITERDLALAERIDFATSAR